MIGTTPVSHLAPLDYRYALDAAAALLGGQPPAAVYCNVAALGEEARQRFPGVDLTPPPPSSCDGKGGSRAVLWIEPTVDSWQTELATIAAEVPAGGTLVVVASRPLARLLPERRGWRGDPLGSRPRGIATLYRGLRDAGFVVAESHGVHSLKAIGLSALGARCERLGRPELGDRLRFAARRAYRDGGILQPLATVALLAARKAAP
ncbi:MAG TPA: hypothetical protein VFZ25_09750 [Chloroflexota bacterium]|nr:hypothetical protein [Chloroflexota bacterium]